MSLALGIWTGLDRCGKTSLHDRRVFLALSPCILVTSGPLIVRCRERSNHGIGRNLLGGSICFLVLLFHIITGVGDTTLARVSYLLG